MKMTDLVPTPSQTIGPFLSIGVEPLARTEVVAPDTPGALRLAGSVFDGAGAPVPDAVVELWQAGPHGSLDDPADCSPHWFGRSLTGRDGSFVFTTVKPAPVPLTNGTLQAPHVELLVFARGLLRPLRTRAYFADEEEANRRDPVLLATPDPDRRRTLVAVDAGDAAGFRFDIHLQGPHETVFFAV